MAITTSSSHRFHITCFSSHILQYSTISKHKIDRCSFPGNTSLRSLHTVGPTEQSGNTPKMDFIVYNGDQSGDLIPFGNLLDSWQNWVPGVVIALIVPFFSNKWGPFAKLKEEVDKVEEKVDKIADVVEEAAEKVEKVVEDIAEDLPAGGKLKATLTTVDNIAKEVAKDTQLVEDMVDKVEEVEKKVETIVGTVTEKPNASAKVK